MHHWKLVRSTNYVMLRFSEQPAEVFTRFFRSKTIAIRLPGIRLGYVNAKDGKWDDTSNRREPTLLKWAVRQNFATQRPPHHKFINSKDFCLVYLFLHRSNLHPILSVVGISQTMPRWDPCWRSTYLEKWHILPGCFKQQMFMYEGTRKLWCSPTSPGGIHRQINFMGRAVMTVQKCSLRHTSSVGNVLSA